MQLGSQDKNIFKQWQLLRKEKIPYAKNRDEYGNWFEDQINILNVFSDEFAGDLREIRSNPTGCRVSLKGYHILRRYITNRKNYR